MTETGDELARQLAALRKSFDESFGRPALAAGRAGADFLLITAGGRVYALRLGDLAGLEVDRRIVAVPAEAGGLLGLCGIRGQLVPVFGLAAVLGQAGGQGEPRWLALHHDKEWTALALDGVQGIRRVAAEDIHRVETGPEQPHLSREAIGVESRLIHVVDMASVISSIRRTVHPR